MFMPNKHVQHVRDKFEKLRKEELAGKVLPYNKLFLSNKYLREVYLKNIKEAQQIVKYFQRAKVSINY